VLLVRLLGLRRYVCKDHEDLSVWDLKHFSRIVRGDGSMGDLKREAVLRWLAVDLVVMSRGERSTKLLEHTALASRVFGVLVDRARVVEVTSAVPTMWGLGSRFDLDLALHVARRYMSCVLQTERHSGWRSRGRARALDAFADLDRVREHVFDAIKPRDKVARSGWVSAGRSAPTYWLDPPSLQSWFCGSPSGYLVEPQNQDWRLDGRRRDPDAPRSFDAGDTQPDRRACVGRTRTAAKEWPPNEEECYLTILPLRGVYLLLCYWGSLVICPTRRDFVYIAIGFQGNSSIRTASHFPTL
jgi:hypothetical protein